MHQFRQRALDVTLSIGDVPVSEFVLPFFPNYDRPLPSNERVLIDNSREFHWTGIRYIGTSSTIAITTIPRIGEDIAKLNQRKWCLCHGSTCQGIWATVPTQEIHYTQTNILFRFVSGRSEFRKRRIQIFVDVVDAVEERIYMIWSWSFSNCRLGVLVFGLAPFSSRDWVWPRGKTLLYAGNL